MENKQIKDIRDWLDGWLKGDVEGYEPDAATYDFVEEMIDDIDNGKFSLGKMKNYPDNLNLEYIKQEIECVVDTCLADCGIR